MKNAKIDWRTILFLFIRQALKVIENKSVKSITKQNTPCFFILDDTLLEKTGKCIEFIGKVYDHCTHTYSLGMKLLTLGFWDGKSFMPLDFSLHNEPGKTGNRGLRKKDITKQFSKERDNGMASFQRTLEISTDKIQMF